MHGCRARVVILAFDTFVVHHDLNSFRVEFEKVFEDVFVEVSESVNMATRDMRL